MEKGNVRSWAIMERKREKAEQELKEELNSEEYNNMILNNNN
jgi:hypothetical protein